MSKLQYTNGAKLSPIKGGYACIKPPQSIPRVISSNGKNNIEVIKRYFCSEFLAQLVANHTLSLIHISLKPERLPEDAKLQLSQIRPYDAGNPSVQDPLFSGYCFLQDGKYTSGVWLCGPEEAEAYVRMQMPYQHRIPVSYTHLDVYKRQVLMGRENAG